MALLGDAPLAEWAVGSGFAVRLPSGYNGNLFLDGQPLTFTLRNALAVSYEVRNYYGHLMAGGAVTGTTLTLAALPLGWYRLYLHQSDGSDPIYGTTIGITSFSILRPDSNFPDPPSVLPNTQIDSLFTSESGPGGSSGGDPYRNWANGFGDHSGRGIAMLGPERFQIPDASNLVLDPPDPSSGPSAIDKALTDKDWYDAWYEQFMPDSQRPRPAFLQFPSGGYQTTAHTDGVTEVVAACYPRIKYFEGPINEPDLSDTTAMLAAMEAFYNAVKAGNPAAKVMGFASVTINGYELGHLDALFAAGAGAYMDAISFHFYNCSSCDITLGRRTMDRFVAMLASHGLQDMELWQTEYGGVPFQFGLFDPRFQASDWLIRRFVLDQYGVPKERDYYFYDAEHGFWSFPSMWKPNDGITPMIALARTYSQELWGKTWTEALDLGAVENDHYIGSRFDAPSGDGVLAIVSGGRTDGQVTLQVAGATSLDVVSPFGKVSAHAVSHGQVLLNVGLEPIYVRVPAAATVTVVPRQYGANVAQWGVQIDAGGTAATRKRLVNGYLEAWRYQGTEQSRTEFRDGRELPVNIDLTLGRHQRIDTVIIHGPYPEQNSTGLLDYDVSYQDPGGTWHLVETVTEPTNVVAAPCSTTLGTGAYLDSYYSSRRIFVHEFGPVVAAAIRLTVRATTVGGAPTQEAKDAQGFGWDAGVTLREIGVYCRDTQVPRPVLVAV